MSKKKMLHTALERMASQWFKADSRPGIATRQDIVIRSQWQVRIVQVKIQ